MNQSFNEKVIIPLWSGVVMLVVMNTTMFNVALPNVSHDFQLSATASSWIITGYSITFAIATITYSRLSDFVPIRRLLVIGLTLLGAASLLGFLSHSFPLLLVARLLQASGAAAVPGLGMVVIARYIPLIRRGKSMSLLSSASSLGFGLGPVVGGALTQFFGWHTLFSITALVLVFIPLFLKLLPLEKSETVMFDVIGGLLTGIGITALLLVLSTQYWLLLVAVVAAFALLWRRIHRVSMPFIPPALLRNWGYLRLVVIGFIAFVIHFSSLFLLPLLLAKGFNETSAMIGLFIFPGAMCSAVAARYIGRWIDQFGTRPMLVTGHILVLFSTSSLALASSLSPYVAMVSYMFMSTGVSAIVSSSSNEITRQLTADEVGSGLGVAQLSQFIGGASGVAFAGIVLTKLAHLSIFTAVTICFVALVFLVLLSLLTVFFLKRSEYNKK